MLLDLGIGREVYVEEFEDRFVEATKSYYGNEADKFLWRGDALAYARTFQHARDEEYDRCIFSLQHETWPRLRTAMISSVLTPDNVRSIVDMENSGVRFYLQKKNFEALKELYDTVNLVPEGHHHFAGYLSSHIRAEGRAIVEVEVSKLLYREN